jgi:hypothetical protein
MKTLYSLIWGQCMDIMRTKIELLAAFEAMSSTSNTLELLNPINNIVFNFQSQRYKPEALHKATRRFHLLQQDRITMVQAYL